MTTHPLTAVRLLWLPLDATQPATCLHIDMDGRVVAREDATPASPLPPSPAPLRLVFPGHEARACWLPLEARSHAQAIAEARARLAPQLAGAADDLHVAVAPATAPDTPRLAVLIERARLQAWLDRARALGAAPVSATPDHLMLPADAEAATAIACDSHWAVRTDTLAFSAEPELARQVLGDRGTWLLQARGEIETLLAATPPAIDLLADGPARQDADAPKRHRRRIAWLAAALALSPALLLGAQALRHAIAGHLLHTHAAERTAELLQLDRRPADPAAEIARTLAQLEAPRRFAGTASALFDALAQLDGAYLAALHYRDGRVEAELVHADPRHGETIIATLADAGIDATLLDSRPVTDGVRSRLQLEDRR